MALDYLLILAMSTDAERLFSSCLITLADCRNRLGDNVLEAIKCLKSWLKIADQEAWLLEEFLVSLHRGLEDDNTTSRGVDNDVEWEYTGRGNHEEAEPWEEA